jgi:hypothetical protein
MYARLISFATRLSPGERGIYTERQHGKNECSNSKEGRNRQGNRTNYPANKPADSR